MLPSLFSQNDIDPLSFLAKRDRSLICFSKRYLSLIFLYKTHLVRYLWKHDNKHLLSVLALYRGFLQRLTFFQQIFVDMHFPCFRTEINEKFDKMIQALVMSDKKIEQSTRPGPWEVDVWRAGGQPVHDLTGQRREERLRKSVVNFLKQSELQRSRQIISHQCVM